jgi:tellurite resistance protein
MDTVALRHVVSREPGALTAPSLSAIPRLFPTLRTDDDMPMSDPHGALISVMVLASVADSDMTDAEVESLTEMVRFLPAFQGFDVARMPALTRHCVELLRDEHGIDKALQAAKEILPPRLRETAYAIACDVMAVDGSVGQAELRLLEMMRDGLEIDRLIAAGIERGSRARHQTL